MGLAAFKMCDAAWHLVSSSPIPNGTNDASASNPRAVVTPETEEREFFSSCHRGATSHFMSGRGLPDLGSRALPLHVNAKYLHINGGYV